MLTVPAVSAVVLGILSLTAFFDLTGERLEISTKIQFQPMRWNIQGLIKDIRIEVLACLREMVDRPWLYQFSALRRSCCTSQYQAYWFFLSSARLIHLRPVWRGRSFQLVCKSMALLKIEIGMNRGDDVRARSTIFSRVLDDSRNFLEKQLSLSLFSQGKEILDEEDSLVSLQLQ